MSDNFEDGNSLSERLLSTLIDSSSAASSSSIHKLIASCWKWQVVWNRAFEVKYRFPISQMLEQPFHCSNATLKLGQTCKGKSFQVGIKLYGHADSGGRFQKVSAQLVQKVLASCRKVQYKANICLNSFSLAISSELIYFWFTDLQFIHFKRQKMQIAKAFEIL